MRWITFRRRTPEAVHLTFDDGPDPELTVLIAQLLESRGHRGTFFLLGERVRKYPEVVRFLVSRGHEVGIHAYHHRSLLFASSDRVAGEILRTRQEILTAAGGVDIRLFRPPFGRVGPAVLLLAWRLNLEVVLWSRNPRDYRASSSGEITARLFRRPLQAGTIILLHDAPPGGPIALRALPRVLDLIEERGLRSVPL